MATEFTTPIAKPEEVQGLRNTVELMDCLSQGGFSEIAAVASLALKSLETPEGYRHLDDIIHALGAIRAKADDIRNCINCEAEQVGCSYVDDAVRRRRGAQRVAMHSGVGHA